jgi:hypothetical protein
MHDAAGLFANFDADEIAAITAARDSEVRRQVGTRAQKAALRLQLRRAGGTTELGDILPPRVEAGDSWHVLSDGAVDALCYLAHFIKATHFDYVAVSTFGIGKADLEQIGEWLDAGRIDQFELYASDLLPSTNGDGYEQMLKLCKVYGCRLVLLKNHSKLMLAGNHAEAYYLAIETSSNFTTNPRIEQTAVHASKELFDFYRGAFSERRSVRRVEPCA